MIWNLWKYGNRPALKNEAGDCITYAQIQRLTKEIKQKYGTRNIVYFYGDNTIDSIAYYLALLQSNQVIILVDKKVTKEVHDKYQQKFLPNLLFDDGQIYTLNVNPMYTNPKLSLVLPTSGSTGASKFVRISKNNIKASVNSILKFLPIDKHERPILTLPMSYVFGLSIIHTHIKQGACIYLSNYNFYHPNFWEYVQKEQCTSFSNVTAAYQMIKKFNMPIPLCIKYFTHSGGRLSDGLIQHFNQVCQRINAKFYRMYGTTECMSRMTYIPPQDSDYTSGTVGKPISGGSISFAKHGHVLYKGKNVAMGYAYDVWSLQEKDNWHGVYYSGDIGTIDEKGYLHIIGRSARFTKQNGYRYSLDDLENLLESTFDCESMITVNDNDMIKIYITKEIDIHSLKLLFMRENISLANYKLIFLTELPYNLNGKKDYQKLPK